MIHSVNHWTVKGPAGDAEFLARDYRARGSPDERAQHDALDSEHGRLGIPRLWLGMTDGDSAEVAILMHQARIRHFDPFGVAQGGLREKSLGGRAPEPTSHATVLRSGFLARGSHARGNDNSASRAVNSQTALPLRLAIRRSPGGWTLRELRRVPAVPILLLLRGRTSRAVR